MVQALLLKVIVPYIVGILVVSLLLGMVFGITTGLGGDIFNIYLIATLMIGMIVGHFGIRPLFGKIGL